MFDPGRSSRPLLGFNGCASTHALGLTDARARRPPFDALYFGQVGLTTLAKIVRCRPAVNVATIRENADRPPADHAETRAGIGPEGRPRRAGYNCALPRHAPARVGRSAYEPAARAGARAT
ncbi:transcriptional regulator, GntR family domain protein [Burkholderia pseudomallei]|nr:transcriptional regulator, GntR family domain protein [Burkholderia pseudomallei]